MISVYFGWTVDFETMRMSMDDRAPKVFRYELMRPRQYTFGSWYFRRNDGGFVGDYQTVSFDIEQYYQKWLVEKVVDAVILEEAL